MAKKYIKENFTNQAKKLREKIIQELEEGKTNFEPSIKIEPIRIDSAVEEALDY